MSNKRTISVIAMIAFLLGGVIIIDIYDKEVDVLLSPQVVVSEPVTIENCLVKVFALSKGQRRCGKGIIVEKNGVTFILTSNMIFVDDFKSITVEFGQKGNWTVRGELIGTNEEWGLAGVAAEPGWHVGYPISDTPNIPPNTESTAVNVDGGVPVRVLDYLNDNWYLITGVDDNYVGAPLVNGEDITGIIIGVNSIEATQAIVIGNRIIREFADQMTLIDAPQVFRPSDNLNMSDRRL